MTQARGRTGIGSAPRALLGAACCMLTLITAASACAGPGNTPGGTPTRTAVVTIRGSAMPALPIPAPDLLTPAPTASGGHRIGVARCAQAPIAVPKPEAAQRGPTPVPKPEAAQRGATPVRKPEAAQRGATPVPKPEAAGHRGATAAPYPAPGATRPDPGDARERAERALESQRLPFPVQGNVPADAAAGATECARLLQVELTLRASGGVRLDEAAIRAALRNTGLTKAVVEPGPRFATSTGRACIIGTVTAGKPAMTIAPLPPGGACRP